MSIGLLALNAQIDARLRAALPAGMGLAVGYAPDNLTELANPVSAHVIPDGAQPQEDITTNARLMAGYTMYVFLDQERITASDEAMAYQFFDYSLSLILGWQPNSSTGECRFVSSPTPLAYDGHIGRLEFSFQIPVYVTRTT